MAHSRGRFPRAAPRSRRKTHWVGPPDQGTINVGSGASVIIGSFEPAASFMLAPTIVRTRGEVSLLPTSPAADLAISGAFGIGIVSNDAFAAGATSIPGPWSDPDWGGWFVWQSFFKKLEFADASGLNYPFNSSYQVDSKAMRKAESNETVVLMAESQAGAFSIAMHVRLLFLLS